MKNYQFMEEGHLIARQFCEMLEQDGIQYYYHLRHSLVHSCSDSKIAYHRMVDLLEKPITICRHILVRERKGEKKLFLIIFDYEKGEVDFHSLKEQLLCKKLEFVREEELKKFLGTVSGNVSIFQTIYDLNNTITVLLDQDLLQNNQVLSFHPFFNGYTIFLDIQ